MSTTHHGEIETTRPAAKVLLTAAVGLVVTVVGLAVAARTTGIGATRLAEPTQGISVDLRFEDGPRGTIRVSSASGEISPVIIAPGQDGFVRTVVRGLARERQAQGFGSEMPFRLGRTEAGRLWLRDLATGRLLYLDAYGPQNASHFARLVRLESGSHE